MDEIQLLMQGISVPQPSLAAAERLPQALDPQPLPPMPAPGPAETAAPSASAVAEEPELVLIRRVEKTPSNGNYFKKPTNIL